MSIERLAALESLIKQDPNNSFVRYALAQALASTGRLDDAALAYRDLIAANGDYVAAYFHGGQTLEKLGRVDDARQLYEQGMAACSRTGDMHTRSEIQAALDILG